jgi:hypothetical protein
MTRQQAMEFLMEAAEAGISHAEGCGDAGRVSDFEWAANVRGAVEHFRKQDKARHRLAVFVGEIRRGLPPRAGVEPDATPKLALILVKPDGSGRIAATFDLAFLDDVETIVGPDPRTEDEREADRILAMFTPNRDLEN